MLNEEQEMRMIDQVKEEWLRGLRVKHCFSVNGDCSCWKEKGHSGGHKCECGEEWSARRIKRVVE